MDSSLFLYTFRKSETTKVLLLVLFASGLYFGITAKAIFAFSLSAVALFFLKSKSGIILDLDNKKFMKARIIRDLKIGSWKEFPELSYISVFRTVITTNSTSLSGKTTSLKEKVIAINFVYDKNKRLNVYQSFNKDDAFAKASFLASKLGLPVYDATSRTGRWIEQ